MDQLQQNHLNEMQYHEEERQAKNHINGRNCNIYLGAKHFIQLKYF